MKILKIVSFFLVELGLALLVYEVVLNQYAEVKPNIQWGLLVRIQLVPIYLFVCLINSIIIFFLKEKKIWVNIFIYIPFALFVARHYSYTPNKVFLVWISSFVGYFLPILVYYTFIIKSKIENKELLDN